MNSWERDEGACTIFTLLRPSSHSRKNTKIFEKITKLFKKKWLQFPKKFAEVSWKLFTLYGHTYKTYKTLTHVYSLTKAQIATRVGAKHFLQFMLTTCGGIFAISQIRSILHTRFYNFFTHHKLNFIQFKTYIQVL